MSDRCYWCGCDADESLTMEVDENDYPSGESWRIEVPVCKECHKEYGVVA